EGLERPGYGAPTQGRDPPRGRRYRLGVGRPVRDRGLEAPQWIRRLVGLPDRDHQPPRVTSRYRQVLRRAPAPVGYLERLARPPAVRAKVAGPEPHRRHLAATGPAGQCVATTAGGIEPGRRSHGTSRNSTRTTTRDGDGRDHKHTIPLSQHGSI